MYLVWRNIARRLGNSSLTIGIVAIAIFVAIASSTVFASLFNGIEMSSQRLGADIIVLPSDIGVSAEEALFTAEPANIYFPANAIEIIRTVDGVVSATPQFFTQTLNQSCCSVMGVTRVVGIERDSDFVISPWLSTGSLSSLGETDILLGSDAPEVVGNTVSILGQTFTVVGTLEPTGTSVDKTIFMDVDTARQVASDSPYLQRVWSTTDPFTSISSIMIKVAIGEDPDDVALRINEAYPYASATAAAGLIKNTSAQLSLFSQVFTGLVVAVFAISTLALVSRFLSLVRDRRKEIGLMRATGFSRFDVMLSVILEAGSLSLFGGIIGSITGVVTASFVIDSLHETLSLPGGGLTLTMGIFFVGLGVIVSLLLGILSSAYPSFRAAKLDPHTVIVRGEL